MSDDPISLLTYVTAFVGVYVTCAAGLALCGVITWAVLRLAVAVPPVGRELRRMYRRHQRAEHRATIWRSSGRPCCTDCGDPIISQDDDAGLCIECGGRNRRCEP